MRTSMSKIIDLALTQALERYSEMSPEAAYAAIVREWPEQLAILLIEFFFKSTCGNCGGMPDFVQIPREQGDSDCMMLLCRCECDEA